MPTHAMWTLIVSLVIYSLGVTYQLTSVSFGLKLRDKEIDRLVQEIALIKNHQEKTIPRLTMLDNAGINEFLEEYANHINILNQIVMNMKTPTRYTAYLKEGGKMTLGLARTIASGDVEIIKPK